MVEMMGLSPDMDLERRQDCACPFEDASGTAPPTLGDTCFADCLAAFLRSQFKQAQINDVVCRSLQDSRGGDAFYPLYYLDQKWCGLVPRYLYGQDPNVDNIINTCNGINFPNLTDPGVPPQSYQCNLCAQPTSNEANLPTKGPVMHLSSTSTSFTTTEPTTTTHLESSTSSASSSAPSTKIAAPTTNTDPAAGSNTGAPEFTLPTTASSSTATQSGSRLPTEAIVAIAVCTVLAVFGAVLLLLCVLRRRQQQQDDYSSDMRSRISRIVQDYTIPPASSPQPLISPTQSYTADRPPLTPPLRLRDRKLLPSLLRPLSRPESVVSGLPYDTQHSNFSNSSHYSGHSLKKKSRGDDLYPASPICSPAFDNPEPRQEKTHQKAASSLINSVASLPPEPSSPPYTRLKSPPPVGFTFPPLSSSDNLHHQGPGSPPLPKVTSSPSSLRMGNMSSSTASSDYNQDHHDHTNARTNSTSTVATVVAAPQQQQPQSPPVSPLTPSPPLSPIRPRRPHDEPLEIPDLVSPLMTSPASPSPGPPPSRALPAPPPPQAGSGSGPGPGRTSSVVSEIGVATTTTTATVANTSTGAGVRRSPGSISLRSLREHQDGPGSGPGSRPEEGGRGCPTASRDSWGSWVDTTGDRSIVGVAMSPSPPRRGGVGTVFPYPEH